MNAPLTSQSAHSSVKHGATPGSPSHPSSPCRRSVLVCENLAFICGPPSPDTPVFNERILNESETKKPEILERESTNRDLALDLSGLAKGLEASYLTYLSVGATVHKMGTVILTSEHLTRVQKHTCGVLE